MLAANIPGLTICPGAICASIRHRGVTARRGTCRATPAEFFIAIKTNMITPRSLEALVRDGLIDEVIRPLKSGKEAAIYVVRCDDAIRCAKVY